MNDLDLTAAIDAARAAAADATYPGNFHPRAEQVDAAVMAALPHIREALAEQIDEAARDAEGGRWDGIFEAARIVRGDAS